MILSRYECQDASEAHMGVCTAVEEVEIDLLHPSMRVLMMMEYAMDLPDINMKNTISFFTNKGRSKFRKGMRELAQTFHEIGHTVNLYELDPSGLDDYILYRDPLQIVFQRDPAVLGQMRLAKSY